MRGVFITFEGGEGSGKSTQIELLAKDLRLRGLSVLVTREPGGTPGAEIVRDVILGGKAKSYGNDIEALLFAVARADHVKELILPALEQGEIVLCDRFLDSTRVYQGLVGDVDRRFLETLEKISIGSLLPDMTIILDLPAKIGINRANCRRGKQAIDRFERDSETIHERRRLGFLRIAELEPERCVVLDATRPIDELAEKISALTQQLLTRRS